MRHSATRALYLMGSLLALTHASPLQVVLADTGAPLTPQEEASLFSRHPEAAGYRVLRWEAGAAMALQDKREVNTDSSFRLHLPLPPGHLELVLEKNSIVAPDFESWSHNASAGGDDEQVLADCFYSGGSSASWAVMSTCDGLSGLLLHHGKTYRLEELPPAPHHRHHHGDPDLPLLVVIPLSPASTATSDTTNLTSVWSHAHTETPHIPADEQRTHTRGRRTTRAVRRRVARKSSKKYTMELAVYIDESLESHVKKRYPKANVKNKLKEIVMTLLNVVSRLFSDPSLGAVSVKLAVMKVKMLKAGLVNEAGGDGNKYLSNFCVWQAESTSKGKQWDHALLLTGVDLYSGDPQSTSTTGMSFIGGMCSPRHSCSIVEGTKFTSAFTIAHEIGHNMNLVHDGEKTAATCSKTGYLMATSLNDGGHKWSSCSKNQLSDFLRNQGTCLVEEGGGNRPSYPFPDEELPGRRFDADQQCHYMFGKGWRHATEHHPDVCQEIWCSKGQRLRSPGVSPLDGTTCGRNKVCIRGRCKPFAAKKSHQYRSSRKRQPGEGRGKKLMKKIVKKVMNKVKEKTRPRHEKKKDEVVEEVEDWNDEGRGYKAGNPRKSENDNDAGEEKPEKQIQPSRKYIKLFGKMMKEAKKSIKRIKVNNRAKSDGEAKEEDEIMETSINKTRETDANDREDPRRDKDEKKQAKNQKLKRIIKQQVKKRLDSINGRERGKDLSKIRKIESPTQIVIKERLNYVKDKGWKVNVLKIKKTKKMANRRVRVKDYSIMCNVSQSQCKITTKRPRKSDRMRQLPPNKGNASKKTNVGLRKEHQQTTSILTRKAALEREQCRPRRVQYVNGKGWLVKVSHRCLRLHQRKE